MPFSGYSFHKAMLMVNVPLEKKPHTGSCTKVKLDYFHLSLDVVVKPIYADDKTGAGAAAVTPTAATTTPDAAAAAAATTPSDTAAAAASADQETFDEDVDSQDEDSVATPSRQAVDWDIVALLGVRPQQQIPSWSMALLAQVYLLHPKDASKTEETCTEVTFSDVSPSATVAKFTLSALTPNFTEGETVKLLVVARYKGQPTRELIHGLESEDLMNSCKQFENAWKNSDIVFVVENQTVFCHSQILSLTSSKLEEIIKGCSSTDEIVIDGTTHNSFVKFLNYLYPRADTLQLSEDDAFELAELFTEYQVHELKWKADKALTAGVNADKALAYFHLANKCNFAALQEKSLELIAAMPCERLQRDLIYSSLRGETEALVLEAKCLASEKP